MFTVKYLKVGTAHVLQGHTALILPLPGELCCQLLILCMDLN